jgi:5-methylcytosine-specific restriction enzyme subunit McrC
VPSSPASRIEESGAVAESAVIECEEHGTIDIPFAQLRDSHGELRLHPDVTQGDYFAVSLKAGTLTLRARGVVGWLPLTEKLVVRVRPRSNAIALDRMMQVAGVNPTILSLIRAYKQGGSWSRDVLRLYGSELVRHVRRIQSHGLWREYQRRGAQTSQPHGRIELHRTVQKHTVRGVLHRAEVAWFERSADIAQNRALKFAILSMIRALGSGASERGPERKLRQELIGALNLFDDVIVDERRDFLGKVGELRPRDIPTNKRHYEGALALATLIVRQEWVSKAPLEGEAQLPSIVVDMSAVFEAYVRETLRKAGSERGWGTVLDGRLEGKRPLFDERAEPKATPDVVINDSRGKCVLVVEVKNVPARGLPSRDALNQAVTYAAAYQTQVVLLVNPGDNEGGLVFVGSVGGNAVYQYRMSLGADARAEEAKFATAIGDLVSELSPNGSGTVRRSISRGSNLVSPPA